MGDDPRRRRRWRPPRLPRPGAAARVGLLSAALLLAAGMLYGGWIRYLTPLPSPVRLPLWAVLLLVAGTESLTIRLSSRRGAASFSLGEAGVVIGLCLAAPTTMLAGWVAGSIVIDAIGRRRTPWRSLLSTLVFLLGYSSLYGCVALLVFHALPGSGPQFGPSGWAAAAAAMVVATVAGNAVVSAAIVLNGTPRGLRESLAELRFNLVTMSVTTSVALAGVTVAWHSPQAALLLLAPVGILVLAWRTYARERPRHDTVALLYETIRRLQDARGVDDIGAALAAKLRETFEAERAEVVLLTEDGGVSAVWTVDGSDGGPRPLAPGAVDPAGAVWAPVLDARAAMLLGRDPERAPGLAAAGMRDAMATPIPSEHGVRGVALVANAHGGLSAFSEADLQLMETLTNHAGVALENARLVGHLREQALHDALTGLANRTLLLEEAEQTLARARRERRLFAVLLLDLDGFKRINDSLGHGAGDQLLVTVAERIRACVRANDTPARLGGDEFAILLDTIDRPDEAVGTAERLLGALTEPIQLDDHAVVAAGSIGVAVWDGRSRPQDVLRDADVAMYVAKRAGKRQVAVFEPRMHHAALERLELEGALRRAVEADELTVLYQPIVALQTGRIVAVDAVAHWPRPDGTSWPLDRFLSLAEETGLIVPIGLATLERACRQVRRWQRELGARAPVLVDVGITPHHARQPQLVGQVRGALRDSGLAARHLELVVAEGTPLQEPSVVASLRTLRGEGVRLAIGGFGSGATNLSFLPALQVDTLKVAGEHVRQLGHAGGEALLAHATIRLGHALGLQLVADGVPGPEQVKALRELRCSLGQGPHLGPALSAEAMTTLLAARMPEALTARRPSAR